MAKTKLLITTLALTCAARAYGATPSIASLTDTGQVRRWEGIHFSNQNAPVPELCGVAATCDEFFVGVDVGAGYWKDRPGGLEVSIQWENEAEDLNLYVYGPDGKLAASSTGFGSRAESVLIPAPANGSYRALVVPSSGTDTGYKGLVEFETTFPTKQGDLLPNLRPLPPRNFNFAIGTYTLTTLDARPLGDAAPSCYAEEIVEQGAQRCLRFDAGSENAGDGRFELRIDLATLASDRTVEQAIYRSGGGQRFRPAGEYNFHPTHGHIHYRNFARYELLHANGMQVARSRKADFCMIDVENRHFDVPDSETQGNDARRGAFPDCNVPSDLDTDSGRAFMVQGISRGWADVYAWPLPGQYIEVSGVPDGTYYVVVTVNPSQVILEANYSDNVACTRIELYDSGKHVRELPLDQACPTNPNPEPPAQSGPIDLPVPALP